MRKDEREKDKENVQFKLLFSRNVFAHYELFPHGIRIKNKTSSSKFLTVEKVQIFATYRTEDVWPVFKSMQKKQHLLYQ